MEAVTLVCPFGIWHGGGSYVKLFLDYCITLRVGAQNVKGKLTKKGYLDTMLEYNAIWRKMHVHVKNVSANTERSS